jgi:hypothetical protein
MENLRQPAHADAANPNEMNKIHPRLPLCEKFQSRKKQAIMAAFCLSRCPLEREFLCPLWDARLARAPKAQEKSQ